MPMRRIELDTKRCLHCGVDMPRRNPLTQRLEGASDYRKRKYCHPTCTAAARRMGPDRKERPCLQCGAALVRKRYDIGRPERWTAFRRRLFCDWVCWRLWLREPTHRARFSRVVSTGRRRRRVRNWNPRGALCQCGHADHEHDPQDGLRCYHVNSVSGEPDCECALWRSLATHLRHDMTEVQCG